MTEAQLRSIHLAISPARRDAQDYANAIRHDFQYQFIPAAFETMDAKAFEAMSQANSFLYPHEDRDDSDMIAGEMDWPTTLRKEGDLARAAIANCSRPWLKQD